MKVKERPKFIWLPVSVLLLVLVGSFFLEKHVTAIQEEQKAELSQVESKLIKVEEESLKVQEKLKLEVGENHYSLCFLCSFLWIVPVWVDTTKPSDKESSEIRARKSEIETNIGSILQKISINKNLINVSYYVFVFSIVLLLLFLIFYLGQGIVIVKDIWSRSEIQQLITYQTGSKGLDRALFLSGLMFWLVSWFIPARFVSEELGDKVEELVELATCKKVNFMQICSMSIVSCLILLLNYLRHLLYPVERIFILLLSLFSFLPAFIGKLVKLGNAAKLKLIKVNLPKEQDTNINLEASSWRAKVSFFISLPLIPLCIAFIVFSYFSLVINLVITFLFLLFYITLFIVVIIHFVVFEIFMKYENYVIVLIVSSTLYYLFKKVTVQYPIELTGQLPINSVDGKQSNTLHEEDGFYLFFLSTVGVIECLCLLYYTLDETIEHTMPFYFDMVVIFVSLVFMFVSFLLFKSIKENEPKWNKSVKSISFIQIYTIGLIVSEYYYVTIYKPGGIFSPMKDIPNWVWLYLASSTVVSLWAIWPRKLSRVEAK